jgi:hypothetical protein
LEGFNVHAGVCVTAGQTKRLEQLIRYVARPPVSHQRISIDEQGNVRYNLKRTWSDGTTAVQYTPHEFIERLVALIPPRYAHQVLYYGVFVPHASMRSRVVPRRRLGDEPSDDDAKAKPKRLDWASMIMRSFGVDPMCCPKCAGAMRVLALIMERRVIEAILTAYGLPTEAPARAPPRSVSVQQSWDFCDLPIVEPEDCAA